MNVLHKHARALFANLHISHSKQDVERFPPFELFLETKMLQIKIISYSIMPLFISAMRSVVYNASEEFHQWEPRAEAHNSRLLLKMDCHFRPVKSASSNRGVLHKNAMKDTQRKKSLRNMNDKISAQEVKIINCNKLEVASWSKKSAKTDSSMTPSKMTTSSAKQLLLAT